MQEDPRFLIGTHIYRINSLFGCISQVGDASNKLPIESLLEHQHSYEMRVNVQSGKLNPSDGNYKTVRIPKSILEGYAESSLFAERFNQNFSEKFGIQLIDQSVFTAIQDRELPITPGSFPTIEIGAFTYEIDVSLQELRQVDLPFNTLSIKDLEIENGKYLIYTNGEGILGRADYFPIRHELPQLAKLVPEEVAKVYGIPVGELPENDSDLRSHPNLIVQRIERGNLPVIRIVDEDYYVDSRMEELRSCQDPFKKIILEENSPRGFEETDNRFVYFYDFLNRKIDGEYGLLTELPKNHVFIVLPDLVTLDPVAAGRKYYDDPTAFLDNYPIQMNMEARVVLPQKTFLPELIRENKRAEQKSALNPNKHQEISGRGKGLKL